MQTLPLLQGAIELPPLPEPFLEDVDHELWGQNVKSDCFNAGQMTAYARQAIAEDRRVRAEPVSASAAANALLHQIDIGDFVDSHGHSAKMLKATHDLMAALATPPKAETLAPVATSEPVAPAYTTEEATAIIMALQGENRSLIATVEEYRDTNFELVQALAETTATASVAAPVAQLGQGEAVGESDQQCKWCCGTDRFSDHECRFCSTRWIFDSAAPSPADRAASVVAHRTSMVNAASKVAECGHGWNAIDESERPRDECPVCGHEPNGLLAALIELRDRCVEVKAALDKGIPDGEPVHPQSARLTWPLSTAGLAINKALAGTK